MESDAEAQSIQDLEEIADSQQLFKNDGQLMTLAIQFIGIQTIPASIHQSSAPSCRIIIRREITRSKTASAIIKALDSVCDEKLLIAFVNGNLPPRNVMTTETTTMAVCRSLSTGPLVVAILTNAKVKKNDVFEEVGRCSSIPWGAYIR
jgi:hypothetical protein